MTTNKKLESNARPDKPIARRNNLIYNPTFRAAVFQTLLVLVLLAFFYSITANVLSNLNSRGITTGFDFLSEPAGFDIGLTLIDYDLTHPYIDTFIVGLLNTALVAVIGIALATVLGFTIGVARLSPNWLVSRLAAVYIETFRNIPLLLQIFFWYFAVLQALPSPRQSLNFADSIWLNVRGLFLPKPIFANDTTALLMAVISAIIVALLVRRYLIKRQHKTGQQAPIITVSVAIMVLFPSLVFAATNQSVSFEYPQLKGFNYQGGISIIPELAALVLALSIYTAAFIAEIVRSGINAVNHGQSEAAAALGLPTPKVLKLIIIPQALRVIIPPLTSQYLNLTKNSSLAMAIGYPDLVSVFAGTSLNQTGQAIEIIAMTMAVYLSLSLLTSVLMNIYNSKVALVGR